MGSQETLLSFLLQNAPRDRLPSDASPQTLHPFASSSPDGPLATLKNLVDASAILSHTLQSYSAFTASDHKLVSILRQSTTLIEGLHTSKQDTHKRVQALKSRACEGIAATYGEPIPLDKETIVEWSISRIEDWGRKNGMEVFKEEEDKNGKMTVMLGGKVLVIDIDLSIQRNAPTSSPRRIVVSNVKTSHALPSGNSGNTLAERSFSLDAFILRTWNDYLNEVQKGDADSSSRAGQISRDIQSHLSYLMKLDNLASSEGDQGIRWFNDTGLINAVTDRISKAEVDALSSDRTFQSSTVNLDVFLSRAHALAIPYLLSPTMSFLVYTSPLAYYSLLCASRRKDSDLSAFQHDMSEAFTKLDIPLPVLREQLTQRRSRPTGTVIATLTLTSISSRLAPQRHAEQRPSLGRPQFRLPGTAILAALDHTLATPPFIPMKDSGSGTDPMQDVWMLDFTEGGHSSGIVMTHTRMREVQQIIDPLNAGSGMGFAIQMQMPPLPGSWVGLLINPTLPPSERYIATYKSPSNAHPPLRLRLTVPNEAGFLLQRVPVSSLREIYGILEIVRDQCWINETLKTINWVAEDLMPESEDEQSDENNMGAPEEDLEALLKGIYTPRRIPVNIFLPDHPPSFSSDADAADGLDLDAESAVPGLSSISMTVGGGSPPPCIALAFAVHGSTLGGEAYPTSGPRQVAIVLRHDRSRKRGLRTDVNVTAPMAEIGSGVSGITSERPSAGLMEELEETSRRGGTFGTAGKVWSWLTKNNPEAR
ncbi:hypothetical protein ACEPAF_7777 [Sanghuangporus sanghuang]